MRKAHQCLCILFISFLTPLLITFCQARSIIRPGRGISKIRIGTKSKALHKLLGQPSRVTQRSDGLKEEIWFRSKRTWPRIDPPFDDLWPKGKTRLEREATDKIKVLYKYDRIIQIEVTAPEFVTRDGISIQSDPLDDIATKYYIKRGDQGLGAAYLYPIGQGRINLGEVAYVCFLDDVQHGIAFREHPTINTEKPDQLEAIVVHRRGYRVIPDEGYVMYTIWGQPMKVLQNGVWVTLK